jgi:Glycosyl hydrolases family 39
MATAIGDDYFDGSSPPDRVRRHFQVARQLGVQYLRCAFSWNGIEKEQGKYDWTFWDGLVSAAEENHIGLIPYVAYTPQWAARDPKDFWKQPPRDPALYADFMNRVAARYRGRVRSWEIWNEPDNRDYWTGTPDEFAALVVAAARSIRAADPDAVLVLGGMAYGPGDFFRRVISEFHLDRYVDVIATHGYPETWLNERAEVIFQQWLPAMRQMIAADQSGADLWINEMGYADYRYSAGKASVYGVDVFHDYEHTRRYQAVMLFKFFVMALASQQVSLAGWYRIDDFPLSETRLGSDLVNFHLGVLDEHGKAKPARFALTFFNRLFATPATTMNAHVDRPAESAAVLNVFRIGGEHVIVTGWLRSPSDKTEVVSADLPCAAPRVVGYYDPEGHRLHSQAHLRNATVTGIHLRGDRAFIGKFTCASSQ